MSDPTQYRYDIYVSYNQADAAWVLDWLLPRLKAAEIGVAIDEEAFRPGAPVIQEVERVIGESQYILAVLSPAYVQDNWDNFETLLVQHEDPGARFRRLIPLLLEPADPPRRIALLHWVDMTVPERREAQLQRVIDTVQGVSELPELRPEKAFPTGWQRWWELRGIGFVSVTVLVLLVLVAWIAWMLQPDPQPTVMPAGGYNIAVAPFTAVEAADSEAAAEGTERAEEIASFLDSQSDALTNVINKTVVVWGPQNGVGPVQAETETQRAMDLNANLLIYGTIQHTDDGRWILSPFFFLRDESETTAEAEVGVELRGKHALGKAIEYRPIDVEEGDVNAQLEQRLEALRLLVRGFVYFVEESAQGYDRAIAAFQGATETEWGQARGSGQEILYYFLGNAYLQQYLFATRGDAPIEERRSFVEKALEAYDEAHELDPFYVRAYNGEGSAYYQLARLAQLEGGGGCQWDWALLDEATLWFQDTLEAPPEQKEDSPNVDMIAHFWIGRIHFTRSVCQQTDAWADARLHYDAAIADYESDPNTTREFTALLAYRERAHADFFAPDVALEPGSPALDGIIEGYQQSVQIGVDDGTEQSRLLAQDSLAFLLNALCQDGQVEALAPTLDTFLENFADPASVRETIVQNARLAARSEECQNAITKS